MVLFLILLIIVLSIPAVQTYIAKKVTDDINEKYGTEISIERLGLNWKGAVEVREIYIPDHHSDTLIYAKRLETNVLSFRKAFKGDVDLGRINMDAAKFYIKTYKGESDDNLYIFTEKFNTGEPPSEDPFELLGNTVSLTNSHIKIIDENLDEPLIFDLTDVKLAARDFGITGPDIEASIESLQLNAARGFDFENLKAEFYYSLEEMRFTDMELSTGSSILKGDMKMDYSESGMSDFVNNVKLEANFKDSRVNSSDLNAFYDEFGPNLSIFLDGKLEGTLNDFTFKNGDVSTGNSRIRGDYQFKNLLDENKEIYIKGTNHNIATNFYDMRRLMPRVLGEQLPQAIKEFGNFTLTGNTVLNADVITTHSNLHSQLGTADINVEIGNINNFDAAYYSGAIQTSNFDLSKLSGSNSLGRVTADLEFTGRGFTQETLSTEISGFITSFGFEGYSYKNIQLNGNLKHPLFNGELTIDDPNLQMDFKGLVDASREFNQYDFEAAVEFAELNKLNLFKRDSVSVFAGRIVMDMDGTTVNDAVGTITFSETFYQNEDDDFFFDDFKITSTLEEEIRTVEVNSPDIINGTIKGRFLIEDIPDLFRNGVGSIYANYIPNEVTVNQYIDYEFEVFNKIVEVFVPQLQFGENTRVKGSVSSDESKFKLDFRSPEILVFDNYLGKVNIQVDNDNPLYNTYMSVDSVYTGFYNLKDLSLINKTLSDTLFIRSEFKGGSDKQDLFNLSLYHTINPEGKSVVGVKRSDITYKDNIWYLNEKNDNLNKMTFDDNFNQIKIDSLILNHNREIIHLAGVIRDSTYKNLRLNFKDVNIGNITPKVDSLNLEGLVNGRLHFLQKGGAYYPNSSVTIDDVVINEIEFGDLSVQINGNEDLTKYKVNTSLTNNNVKSIDAVGEIDVTPDEPLIDLNVNLNRFDMRAFSPFGADVITNIRGYTSGIANIRGNYKSPEIFGTLELEESGMTIPYLNIDFDLDNNTKVFVTKNKFNLGTTTITDTKYNTTATLSGNITHTKFKDWALDLKIDTDRLLVLDTPPDEDALYYGTAFISGEAEIKGPAEELVIDVVATTEEGTSFKIPLSDTESIGDDSFIKFLSPSEKEARINGETIVSEKIKGLSLNFELDINDKAEVEVVVDQVNNSTLKGRGAGILLIEINTLGKFRMWGDFLVIEGEYDFRYGGIIQKTIEVVPGGNITWDGSPERANLDLSALYETDANPSILLDNPTVNTKIPVNVIVDLTGELIQPNINFRIEFPRVSSVVRSELEYKLQNQGQRERQALFLFASGSFVSDTYQGGDAITGTLVERVSSLVNDIFADQDGKFKVGLDYQTGSRTPDQETSDRFGITLSTHINERILINGKVGVPVGGVNESTVAGDIEVQWLVNEDGSLRINFFNRQADIQFVGEDQIFEQGAGVSYSVDFDTFRELVNKLFNRKLTLESEENLPVSPDDDSIPESFDPKAINEKDRGNR